MQGLSMLCGLKMDYQGAHRWYGELQQFAERCGKQDAAGKEARSRLAWLDISLPQRDVEELTETIPAVFRLITNKEVSLSPFSVTSTLPSIMNGGKDFPIGASGTTCCIKRCGSRWRRCWDGTVSVWQTAPLLRASSKRERILRRVC